MLGSPTIFVCAGRPPTANKTVSGRGQTFLRAVMAAHHAAGGQPRDGLLYGIVYWLARAYDPHRHADADNMSKKVWDALRGQAYGDDKQVRLRIAGVIDLSPMSGGGGPGIEALSLSDAPAPVLDALESILAADGGASDPFAEGALYVEVGPLTPEMFRFGLVPLVDPRAGPNAERGRT
jgi:Endodeoxyribonuclease RusA